MKTDTQTSFTKRIGSLNKARNMVRSLLEQGEVFDCWTARGSRGAIGYAHGVQNKFRWRYDGENKTLQVTYTDGRPEAVKKENKRKYFIIWIEGIDPKSGEKIHSLNSNEHTYTTNMTEALRVKQIDLQRVISLLRSRGIAEWVLQSPNTFVRTNYAPKGTIYKP